jgi:uncharacterized protein
MHLVDVNVWLALAFKRHKHHASAVAWFRTAKGPCLFCRSSQGGFLRLASNPVAMGPAAVTLADAWRAYDAFLADPNIAFIEEPPGVEVAWRFHTQNSMFSPKVWNDAYLAALAEVSGYEVVTFDHGFSQFKNVRSTILS